MSLPSFYDASRYGEVYAPDTDAIIEEGLENASTPAREDDQRTMLLLIDIQIDFVHEDGSLSVPGALDDTQRTVEWMYAHIEKLTTIAASLDSHIPNQIFYPGWWVDPDGNHPAPYTMINASDVNAGLWQPTTLPDWSKEYVRKLEENAQKVLTIWPFHCMIGTPGHRIVPAVYEAVTYHAAVRATQPHYIIKGTIPKTEHYSLMEPEIDVPEEPNGTLNMRVIDMITTHDRVYLAGQAKSHCVLETTRSLVDYFAEHDPDVIERLTFLKDAASPVAHPDVDFDAYAEAEFKQLYDKGLQAVTLEETKF